MRAGSEFVRNGRILTLASWLEKLASNFVYAQPALISLLGLVHSSKGETSQAIEFYDLAEEKFQGSDDRVEFAITLVRRAEAYRQLGDFERSLSDVDQTLELTRNSQDMILRQAFAEAQRIKGLSLFGLGKLEEALSWLKDALQSCRELEITSNIPILETELGVVWANPMLPRDTIPALCKPGKTRGIPDGRRVY